jgi:hypothetical protein
MGNAKDNSARGMGPSVRDNLVFKEDPWQMRRESNEYNSNAFQPGADSVPDNPEVPDDHRASDLVRLVKDLVFSLGAASLPFQRAWPKTVSSASPTTRAGTSQLAVQRWLGDIEENVNSSGLRVADGSLATLVAHLCHDASKLEWRQTYTAAEASEEFLSNYGYTEIIGSAAPGDNLAAGFLLLGPHTFYPRHHHEAEEIYVPLSGTAEWLQGDGIWRSHPPGTIIHHVAHESHAMRTHRQPLLALYLWLSDNLKQRAQLE